MDEAPCLTVLSVSRPTLLICLLTNFSTADQMVQISERTMFWEFGGKLADELRIEA